MVEKQGLKGAGAGAKVGVRLIEFLKKNYLGMLRA